MADWVVRLIEQSGYLGVGFLMFLETLFPPIPSEIIMPVAGVAAGHGKGERPCWVQLDGTIDYLYDVVLTSRGIKMRLDPM